MRAAIVGCGDIHIMHALAIDSLEGAELVAVCDVDPGALAAAEARYGVPGFADHRRMLEAVRPDVVHVCTPHDQHAPCVIDALEAGAHVLQEKPVAHTLAEAERIIAAADAAPGQAAVCFQNRYNATAQEAKRIIESGELGAPLGASATVLWSRDQAYYDVKPWRGTWENSGGGALINQAIHTIDLAEWLLGEVVSVSGHASNRRHPGIEVEDTAEAVFEHAGGARTVFFATTAHVANEPVRVEIVLERGRLSLGEELVVHAEGGSTRVVKERQGPDDGRSYWGVSHQELIGDFYAAIREDHPFWISPRVGLRSLSHLKEIYAQSGYTEAGAR
ncbi:MAG: Gfo/Idh/MocA family oxidoreductase [Arthrobacter sp.]|jgi:predicted dehydrogenase|nr:Gfo/Idh/MocA family oxidoreductase [Arthrobacter sp.]